MLSKKLLFVVLIAIGLTFYLGENHLVLGQTSGSDTTISDLAKDIAEGEAQISKDSEAKAIQQEIVNTQVTEAGQKGNTNSAPVTENLDPKEAVEPVSSLNPTPAPQTNTEENTQDNSSPSDNNLNAPSSSGNNLGSPQLSEDPTANDENGVISTPAPSGNSGDTNSDNSSNSTPGSSPSSNNQDQSQPPSISQPQDTSNPSSNNQSTTPPTDQAAPATQAPTNDTTSQDTSPKSDSSSNSDNNSGSSSDNSSQNSSSDNSSVEGISTHSSLIYRIWNYFFK